MLIITFRNHNLKVVSTSLAMANMFNHFNLPALLTKTIFGMQLGKMNFLSADKLCLGWPSCTPFTGSGSRCFDHGDRFGKVLYIQKQTNKQKKKTLIIMSFPVLSQVTQCCYYEQ